MVFNSVAIASDHRGFWLKKDIAEYFEGIGFQVIDYGTDNDCVSVDYPDFAKKVSKHVISDKNSFGVLICHSGVGMNIAANRFQGVRSVLCYNEEIAKLSREHNNANVLCFGSGFISQETALRCAHTFSQTNFLSERHSGRIEKIDVI